MKRPRKTFESSCDSWAPDVTWTPQYEQTYLHIAHVKHPENTQVNPTNSPWLNLSFMNSLHWWNCIGINRNKLYWRCTVVPHEMGICLKIEACRAKTLKPQTRPHPNWSPFHFLCDLVFLSINRLLEVPASAELYVKLSPINQFNTILPLIFITISTEISVLLF